VVVGAGGGGLGAGAKLALSGKKVLVLEQHDKVGGYMTAFERDDYTFEVSLHAVSGFTENLGLAKGLFQKLGILDKVQPIHLKVPYRIVGPDLDISVPGDPAAYQATLKATFPQQAKALDKLFKTLDNAAFAVAASRGKAKGAPPENPGWPFQKYGNVSAAAMLGEYIQDPKLLSVFSWLRGYCGVPLDQIPAPLFLGMWCTYHHDGYFYFKGGSQAISNALAKVITDNGGRIELGALVTKIVIQDGKAVAVKTKSGSEFKCRYVVSNASAPTTLNKLVGREFFPAEYLTKLDAMEIGPSILQVFLGVDHDYRPQFQGAHTISVVETYDYHLEQQFFDQGNVEKASFFMVNYSVSEPDVAPKGKNVIVFTTYMPYDWKSGWYEDESREKYEKLKEKVAQILIKRAEKYLPGLSSHVEVMEVGSPRTMEHYTLNPKGAVYGWKPDMKNSGANRLAQETPIPNLLLAGVWTRSGHGQMSALSSGAEAADKIVAMAEKTSE